MSEKDSLNLATTLIEQYLQVASDLILLLRKEQDTVDIGHPWNRDRYPRSGSLSDGTVYSFHGAGVVFQKVKGDLIDIDFDRNFNCTEFNAWRLAMYVDSLRAATPELCGFSDPDVWTTFLFKLEERGLVVPGQHRGWFKFP